MVPDRLAGLGSVGHTGCDPARTLKLTPFCITERFDIRSQVSSEREVCEVYEYEWRFEIDIVEVAVGKMCVGAVYHLRNM